MSASFSMLWMWTAELMPTHVRCFEGHRRLFQPWPLESKAVFYSLQECPWQFSRRCHLFKWNFSRNSGVGTCSLLARLGGVSVNNPCIQWNVKILKWCLEFDFLQILSTTISILAEISPVIPVALFAGFSLVSHASQWISKLNLKVQTSAILLQFCSQKLNLKV